MQQGPNQILVVEDNAAMATVIRYNLERAGYVVHVASDGLEGVRLLEQHQIHLIITDQQMPIMDGLQFCHEMRKLDAHRHTPTIMLTAKGLEVDLQRLKESLGITALFPKPFSPTELVEAVDRYLAPVA